MPSSSAPMARYMAMMAHDPAKAKAAGMKVSVAREFNRADSKSGLLSSAMRQRAHRRGGHAPTVMAK